MGGAIADVRLAVPDAALILDCEALAPAPVHDGRPTIWQLATLPGWLRDEKSYPVGEELIEPARTTMEVNLAVAEEEAEAALQHEILEPLA